MFLLWESRMSFMRRRPAPHVRLSKKKLTRKPEGHD